MIKIIDDNDQFIIATKPSGVDFHNCEDTPGFFTSLQNLVNQKLYPVHRLDKVTSGILVFAKTKKIAVDLNNQFQNGQISKCYLALAKGKPKKKQGYIKGDMERGRRGSWKLLRSMNNPAITQFNSYLIEPGLRLYLLHPITGRTHQLRVAMKSISVPIFGDRLYGGNDSDDLEFDRCYLHSFYISFQVDGKRYDYSALPDKGELFIAYIDKIGSMTKDYIEKQSRLDITDDALN